MRIHGEISIPVSMAAWTLLLVIGVMLIWLALLSSVAYLVTQRAGRR